MYYIVDVYDDKSKKFILPTPHTSKKDAILCCMKQPCESRIIEIGSGKISVVYNNRISGNILTKIKGIIKDFNEGLKNEDN